MRDDLIARILMGVTDRGFQPDLHFHRLCLDEALSNAIIHGNRSDPTKTVTVRVFGLETAGVLKLPMRDRGSTGRRGPNVSTPS